MVVLQDDGPAFSSIGLQRSGLFLVGQKFLPIDLNLLYCLLNDGSHDALALLRGGDLQAHRADEELVDRLAPLCELLHFS